MVNKKSEKRIKSFEIYKENNGEIQLKDIAITLGVSASLIRKWKSIDDWDKLIGNTSGNTDSHSSNINDRVGNATENTDILIEILLDENNFLKEQIKIKDDQIKNTQILLAQAQEKISLPEQKKAAEKEVSVTEEKGNFFTKLFKRR